MRVKVCLISISNPQIRILNDIELLYEHKFLMKDFTSNMTFLRRALDVIGGLYDGNVQILPTKKTIGTELTKKQKRNLNVDKNRKEIDDMGYTHSNTRVP